MNLSRSEPRQDNAEPRLEPTILNSPNRTFQAHGLRMFREFLSVRLVLCSYQMVQQQKRDAISALRWNVVLRVPLGTTAFEHTFKNDLQIDRTQVERGALWSNF